MKFNRKGPLRPICLPEANDDFSDDTVSFEVILIEAIYCTSFIYCNHRALLLAMATQLVRI